MAEAFGRLSPFRAPRLANGEILCFGAQLDGELGDGFSYGPRDVVLP